MKVLKNWIRSALVFLSFIVFFLFNTPAAVSGTLAETRGIGARAIAMGGAFTAVADDVSALYYNPAGLAQIHGHHGHLEYLFVCPRTYVSEGNGPDNVLLDKETKAPMLGIVIDLSKAIKLSRRIVVGWNGYFPDNFKSVYKVRYGTEYDPMYPLYGDGHADQTIALWTNGALEVFPWLLVGAGFTLQIHGSNVQLEVGVDPQGRPVVDESRARMDVTTEVYPMAGIMLKPISRLRLGFTWRKDVEFIVANGMQMEMKLVLEPNKTVPVPVTVNLPAQGHYRPMQYAFGASYQLREDLLLAADLTYYDWRPYRDDASRDLDSPMKEIVVPRCGLEYYLLKDLALRMGYSFQKSPLRQQPVGYHTNLLDNDVHSICSGIGYLWNPFDLLPTPIQWSVFYQAQLLVPRTFQNVHPGEPDLRSSGTIHSFGFSIHFYM